MTAKICKKCGKEREMFWWENVCYLCRREENKERITNAIQNSEDADTFSSDYVICPYCGHHKDTDYGYEDFPELYDEGDHEIVCEGCGKTFVLSSTCTWYYETSKKEDSDETD